MRKFEILKALNECERHSNCMKRKVGAIILSRTSINGLRGYAYNYVANFIQPTTKRICNRCVDGGDVTGLCPAIHAEVNAIINARSNAELSAPFNDIFISYSPCPECCKAIIQARFSRVVVKEPRVKELSLIGQEIYGVKTYDELAEKLLTDAGIKYIKLWEYETEQEVI